MQKPQAKEKFKDSTGQVVRQEQKTEAINNAILDIFGKQDHNRKVLDVFAGSCELGVKTIEREGCYVGIENDSKILPLVKERIVEAIKVKKALNKSSKSAEKVRKGEF